MKNISEQRHCISASIFKDILKCMFILLLEIYLSIIVIIILYCTNFCYKQDAYYIISYIVINLQEIIPMSLILSIMV